ncbi:MAG: hypothetical protein J3K34DRAFT_406344 [Monoraphidium minutum]|nr:MAG: hypothetical protein J3K34DRAFT_406344 [Monoraphidium minutum]
MSLDPGLQLGDTPAYWAPEDWEPEYKTRGGGARLRAAPPGGARNVAYCAMVSEAPAQERGEAAGGADAALSGGGEGCAEGACMSAQCCGAEKGPPAGADTAQGPAARAERARCGLTVPETPTVAVPATSDIPKAEDNDQRGPLRRHLGGAQGGRSLLVPCYCNCAGAPEFCGHVPKFGDEYMDATKGPRANLVAEDRTDASAAARTVLRAHPPLSAPRALAPCGPVGWRGPSYVAVPKADLYKIREACALI